MLEEIIIYQPNNSTEQYQVRIENENIWLNRHQIANMFDRDVKTIGKHISNALREELKMLPVVANFATTASDGKTYQVEYYNLEMIISIGYRVKSDRGILFRSWANNVLKEFLIKKHVVQQRIERVENDVAILKNKVQEFDIRLNTTLHSQEGIFYDGQVFDAYVFVANIIKSANKSIIVIDNYVDETVLLLLSKRQLNVSATIYTASIPKHLQLDLQKYNAQYPAIEIKTFSKSHDRFIILDNKTLYHIGASLKDLGKKWFAFSKFEMGALEVLERLK